MIFGVRRVKPIFKNAYNNFSKIASSQTDIKYVNKQIIYINDIANEKKHIELWPDIKKNVLSEKGNINENNINAVLLNMLVKADKYESALSFADFLKRNLKEQNLGTINSLLKLYYELGKKDKLSNEDKTFVMHIYEYLYDKHKFLESKTCESLLHALCVLNEWKICLKVLEDIKYTNTPSHSAYSTLIATLFRNNKKTEAMKLIKSSIDNDRPLIDVAYDAWIEYILKKYKDKNTILKHLFDINQHLSMNATAVSTYVANSFKKTYNSLGWTVKPTIINRYSGQCMTCKETLDCLTLNKEEFAMLQVNVKEKLVVGTDLFLKSSPQELKRFQNFLETYGPFDVVLDALNIGYASGNVSKKDRVDSINLIVNYFSESNQKILLLGRKHMLRWSQKSINDLLNKTCGFFTEDISEDDPYIITAAILSGPHADIVSKDILRGHRFKMGNEKMRQIFQRWQWQHQWMVFNHKHKGLELMPPLTFTPCAQKNISGWHIPYSNNIKDKVDSTKLVNDGIPDLTTWLCLKPS